MQCQCGGKTKVHETKHAYVHTCNGCGRRHEIPKETFKSDMLIFEETTGTVKWEVKGDES